MRTSTLALLLTAACQPSSTSDTPDSYVFVGRDGGDSVSYGGQVFRHLLMHDLKVHIGGITERIDKGWTPARGDVAAEIQFYLAFDSETAGALDHSVRTEPAPLQGTYDDVSSGKDLLGKLAGNDPVGQHKDWNSDLEGWSDVASPEGLVLRWVDAIDEDAYRRGLGDLDPNPAGEPLSSVYVSADGLDHLQLLDKFLAGAIALSQGADDYLDDDVEGKGLLADHTVLVEGEQFTELEHAWDEGFGYFGAARSYGTWTDQQVIDGHLDVDEDGAIDLLREVSVGHSVNAAKRDAGSVQATEIREQAWRGFVEGRQLLAQADGALSDAELEQLRGHRDRAVLGWEQAIGATMVHYINETLVDMEAIGTPNYDFEAHAKHWSELKGFALVVQFNPRSPVSDADFARLHELIGDRPVTSAHDEQERERYARDLLEARVLLGVAYAFEVENLGDDHGLQGW